MELRSAILRALIELSTPTTLASGLSFAIVIAMHPDPVPISNILGDLTAFNLVKAISISLSVSGRGIRTSGVIINSLP